MDLSDLSRKNLSQSGLKARSPEGHAARAMHIKGDEYVWVEIQEKTFTNWVNEQVRGVGMSVKNLKSEFCSGLKLIALMEVLQKKKLKKISKPLNQHQYLENVQIALDSISSDGIKLVNIGNTDIVEGNLKLILGLVWSLILRYQIGRTHFPPKKFMLSWLQAVLPERNISNFTSDWRNGIALSALIDFCKPGLIPHWRTLISSECVENCRRAMYIARDEFNIPLIIAPEDLASDNMDELSVMTYLSYYMREESPGYKATLKWMDMQLPHLNIKNFTTDWNDGLALCSLVQSFGANIPDYSSEKLSWEQKLQFGLNGGLQLGVEPLLKAKDMADPEVEYLGVMAYIAHFQWVTVLKKSSKISITGTDLNNVHVNKPAHFRINLLDKAAHLKFIRGDVKSPSGSLECRINTSRAGGAGTFIPTEVGIHELTVFYENEVLAGCPLLINVHPDISKILFSGIDPCALGSVVEVLINSNGAGNGTVQVDALSPCSNSQVCPVSEKNGVYTATFIPDEIGEWKILVTYSGEHIKGSPFTCYVYDPAKVKVHTVDLAVAGQEVNFICDASAAGWGKVKIEIDHKGCSIPVHVDERGNGIYHVAFIPHSTGTYTVIVMFNGLEIKGSPFVLEAVEENRYLMVQDNIRGDLKAHLKHTANVFQDQQSSLYTRNTSMSKETGFGYSPSTKDKKLPTLSSPLGSGETSYFDVSATGTDLSKKIRSEVVDNNLLSTKVDRKHSSNMFADSKQLSFHERADLINSKLSASKERLKSVKAPLPPPTMKKPVGVESVNWSSKDHVDGMMKLNATNNHEEFHWKLHSDISQENYKPNVLPGADVVGSKKLLTAKANVRTGFHEDSKESHYHTSASNVQQVDTQQQHYNFRGTFDSLKHKSEAIVADGEGLKLVPVKQPTTFTLTASGMKRDDIQVTITAPSGKELPFHLESTCSGEYLIEYITPEVGEHLIDILVGGRPLSGSPFHCYAFDASRIQVGKIPNGVVDKAVEFEIDGAHAGSGNLEILVNGGHVTSNVKSLGNHRFLASFIPHTSTTHTIEMKFNGHHVPGSPWKCEVSDPNRKISVQGEALQSFSTQHSASFEINAFGFHREDIRVNISGPSKNVQHRVADLNNGLYRVDFNAFEVGSYVIEVLVAGHNVPGSPFMAKAYNASCIQVSNVPQFCITGEMCQFHVNASQAGEGQLEISVNDGQVPNQVQVLGNGRCLVSFLPEKPEPHTIDIKFNGENVPGCPILLEANDGSVISVDVNDLQLIPVWHPSHFTLNLKGGHESDLKVSIMSPSEEHLPVRVVPSIGKCFSVEFSPKEVGPHIVIVEYKGKIVSGFPYSFKTYDHKKVEVSRMPQGALKKAVKFTVDASLAGEGNLEITVCGRDRNIPTQVHPLGSAKFGVSFVPTDPVEHIINISFNKEPVPGSPFKVLVADSNKIAISGHSQEATPVGTCASLLMENISNVHQDVAVQVEGPDQNYVPCTLLDSGDNSAKVEFTPNRTGEYKVHVSYMGSPISGSPFTVKAYDVKQIKVKSIPRGYVDKPVTFLVETTRAGPGNLEVVVNNGEVPTVPQAQSHSLYAISFTPKECKKHFIDLKFNGESAPGSPFECTVIDTAKVQVKGDGIDRVPINKRTSFLVETHNMDVGELHVTILGPSQNKVENCLTGTYHSGYKVEYTPEEVGDYTIDVRADGQQIAGSPYLVKAYDSGNVKVTDINSGVVGKPVYFSIDASQAGAGNLEIIVSVGGRNVPNYVQSEGNAKFRVNFKPAEAQIHTLSIKFNGEPVPGSPFYVKITDSTQSVITGSTLRMTSLSRGTHFSIDTRGSENAECIVFVTGPSGKQIPVKLGKTSSTTFDVDFSPIEVGPHQVTVSLNNTPVLGSPFTCNVYDVSKVKVSKLGSIVVGKPCTFQVDASQAGEGTLELVVTTRKSSVRAEVSMRSRGLYDVTFVPQDKISHYVNITFNEEDILGSPFKIEVHDMMVDTKSSKGKLGILAKGEGLKMGLVGSVNSFDITTNGQDGSVDVKITGPTGIPVQPSILRSDQDTYHVEYNTREVGTYKLEIFHDGSAISSKPFLAEVCDPSRVKVIEVEDGVVGREQSFKVDASRAGRGNLTVNISAGGKDIKHLIQELSSGMYVVTYTPFTDQPHKIDVYYSGHQTPGCPQVVDIHDPSHSIIAHGSGLKSSSVRKHTSFFIETGGFGEAKDFDIIVTDPGDNPLPVKCYQQKDGSLLVEWIANHIGNHKIEVLYSGKPIIGSPFSCQVFDASQVFLQKMETTTFSVHEKISFMLNRRDAGYAELDVTVTSPLGRHLPIEVKGTPDGEGELIEFTPIVSGKYKIAITFGGLEIPGSPVTFIAQEGESPRIEGKGLTVAECNAQATFKIIGKGLWGNPEVDVHGPQSKCDCSIQHEEDAYVVSYIPQEIGTHVINILWNGRAVPGSPFHSQVVNLHKVRVIGGWAAFLDEQNCISLAVNEEKQIQFDVSEAGPGKLTAEVNGPSGLIPVHVDHGNNHSYHICFTPTEEGNYHLYIYFAGLPLPDSPFLATTEDECLTLDHTRVVLRGHGLTGANVGEESDFIIDGSEAGPGSPEVSLSGVKADILVKLLPLGNNVYKALYTPTISGAYLLNIMWSERQVKGCPLKVTVTASCDASKVNCSGDGLRGGTMGKEIKAFIDTRKAGPGELAAQCMGPHKIAYCELYDHRDGTFTLYLRPQEGGRHMLSIKYGGEHVTGSPFTLRITGAPDASKVRVYGPGIEPGVLATYQSRLICDTRGAGAGQLTVRIRGPKGAFRVEMQRESQKDRTILCKYDPTEPGDYRVEVKWSGEHVPGSPFMVMIFDTQEELNHYLQGQYQHPPGTSGSLPPSDYFGGSMTYSTGFGQMSWRGSTAEL